MAVPTSTAHLTCLCGAVREPGTLLEAETFPIDPPELCHCNPCRQTTGSLGASFPQLKDKPSQKSIDACTQYASTKTHNRYFCSTCGTPTFIEVKLKGYWCCLAGIVERDPDKVGEGEEWAKDIVKVNGHEYVGDTGDGGIAARLSTLGGRDVSCYKEAKKEGKDQEGGKVSKEEMRAMQEESEKGEVAGKDELMEVRCHCGGVDLKVKRADFDMEKQGLDETYTEAGDRYVAAFCACRSCRLQTGVSLHPWAYIPPQNFTIAKSGEAVVFGKPGCEHGANRGTALKHYWSSKDRCRSFCGSCGASFFYWSDERPELVDLSVGVIRAKGSMAREWLSWKWRVSHTEECVDEEIMNAVGDE